LADSDFDGVTPSSAKADSSDLPAGAKFGEAGERMRSARARSGRQFSYSTAVNGRGEVAGEVEMSSQEAADMAEAEQHIVDEGDAGQDFDENAEPDELLGW